MSVTHYPDWRVTEGPAIGREPVFVLTNIRLSANFYITGTMSRGIVATLATSTPTRVETVNRSMSEMTGFIRIFDEIPERSYLPLFQGPPGGIELRASRGVLWIVPPDRFAVDLYLPPHQFEKLIALFSCGCAEAELRVEVDRSLDQGLCDEDVYFWNDRLSPVVLFNEFEITVHLP